MNLISKLTITISVVLLLVMAPFVYFNIKNLKQVMLQEAIAATDKLSETIIRTTYHLMLENDREKISLTVEEAGAQKDIEHIRMINKDGQIVVSTDAKEVGTFLDKRGSSCSMCHASEKPLLKASSLNRSRTFYTRYGREVLAVTRAIYNEPACSNASCHFHASGQEILGVLDMAVSLDSVRAQIAAYRNSFIAMTVLMLTIIAACLTLLMRRLVHRPVRGLLAHTDRLAHGDLMSRIVVTSHDELGELGEAFNNMTESLGKARDELKDWAKTLEVKVQERTHELKKMQAQLVRSEKLASMGELVAGIAHELNNPLTGILIFSSILSKEAKLDLEAKNDIDVIVRETQRCATIVKGLLDFSRESIPQKELTSLNKIMDNTLSLIGHQSFFHDIEMIKTYGEELPQVLADPNQIEQVFINTLLNASQAMSGRGTLRIDTGVTPDGLWGFVRIADTGCGISEENLARIFDPFFTTKESKGTGLGLSVSYGIVQNHGGQIEVQSTVGVGTTFTVKLPFVASGRAEGAAA